MPGAQPPQSPSGGRETGAHHAWIAGSEILFGAGARLLLMAFLQLAGPPSQVEKMDSVMHGPRVARPHFVSGTNLSSSRLSGKT